MNRAFCGSSLPAHISTRSMALSELCRQAAILLYTFQFDNRDTLQLSKYETRRALHQQQQIRHLFRARSFFKDNTKMPFGVPHMTVVFTKTEFPWKWVIWRSYTHHWSKCQRVSFFIFLDSVDVLTDKRCYLAAYLPDEREAQSLFVKKKRNLIEIYLPLWRLQQGALIDKMSV